MIENACSLFFLIHIFLGAMGLPSISDFFIIFQAIFPDGQRNREKPSRDLISFKNAGIGPFWTPDVLIRVYSFQAFWASVLTFKTMELCVVMKRKKEEK